MGTLTQSHKDELDVRRGIRPKVNWAFRPNVEAERRKQIKNGKAEWCG